MKVPASVVNVACWPSLVMDSSPVMPGHLLISQPVRVEKSSRKPTRSAGARGRRSDGTQAEQNEKLDFHPSQFSMITSSRDSAKKNGAHICQWRIGPPCGQGWPTGAPRMRQYGFIDIGTGGS